MLGTRLHFPSEMRDDGRLGEQGPHVCWLLSVGLLRMSPVDIGRRRLIVRYLHIMMTLRMRDTAQCNRPIRQACGQLTSWA